MNRSELQQQIEATEKELKELQEQLDNCYPSLEESQPGDELEGGWIVVEKYNGAALLAAPQDTEKKLSWNDRNKVLEGLPGDCFIPSIEHLQLAYKNARQHFKLIRYWSSVENNARGVVFYDGLHCTDIKTHCFCVRAFRFVVF